MNNGNESESERFNGWRIEDFDIRYNQSGEKGWIGE